MEHAESFIGRRTLDRALRLLLLSALGVYLVGAGVILAKPEAVEYGEPFIVSASFNLSQGGRLYAPVDELPFLHNNYNPFVQTMLAPVMALTGPSYWPFRLVTVSSVIASLLLLGGLVRRKTGSPLAGLVTMACPLAGGFVIPWLAVGRVDAFALLCALGALRWVATRDVSTFRQAWPAVLMATLAVASKQTMMAVPGAIILHLAWDRRWRMAIGFGFAWVAAFAAVVLLAQWLTDGQYWLHAVEYNASHDRTAIWPEGLGPSEVLAAFGLPVVALAALSTGAWNWQRDRLLILWFLLALPWACFLVRKDGSHVHYYFESILALTVTSTIGFWSRFRPQEGKSMVLLLFVGLLLIPGLPWRGPRSWRCGLVWHATLIKTLHQEDLWGQRRDQELMDRIRQGDGPSLLLSQTATLSVENKKAAIFDVGDFVRLYRSGRWSPKDRLIPLIEKAAFPVIGIQEYDEERSEERFGISALPGVREAIEANYRFWKRHHNVKPRREATFWLPDK